MLEQITINNEDGSGYLTGGSITMDQLCNLPIREKDQEAIGSYVDYMKVNLEEDLYSIILYGSAVKDNYFPGSSDLNVMLVVKDMNPTLLQKTAPIIKGYDNRTRITTFFADIGDVRDAADVFPIMYLDIKKNHLLLHGEDIFDNLDIDESNLRLDVERQLRTMVTDLRREYILSNYTSQEMRSILVVNFSGLTYLLSALLYLHKVDPPSRKQDIVRMMVSIFDIDLTVFDKIVSLKMGMNNLPKQEMYGIFEEYLNAVEKFVDMADKFNEKAQKDH